MFIKSILWPALGRQGFCHVYVAVAPRRHIGLLSLLYHLAASPPSRPVLTLHSNINNTNQKLLGPEQFFVFVWFALWNMNLNTLKKSPIFCTHAVQRPQTGNERRHTQTGLYFTGYFSLCLWWRPFKSQGLYLRHTSSVSCLYLFCLCDARNDPFLTIKALFI